jgi:integrase
MIKLKGVHTVRSKGRVYYYAWRGGPPLEGEPGSPEFIASYQEARTPLSGLDKRKFSAWITLYKASDEFNRGLAPSTQRQWRPWFDKIQDHFGDLSLRQFDRPKIRRDIKKWCERWRDTPRTADYGRQVLSRILKFAVDEGELQFNPCKGMPNLYSSNRAEIIWKEDDLETLAKHASPEIVQAACLAALTGLRQGDLLRLSWSHVAVNEIRVRTSKSRGRRTASIPITSVLRELLGTIPKRATTVLTNTEGRPWKSGFTASWNKAMKRAALADRDLHFHDLRGTAATNFYRAGLSEREIAEIMGWSEETVRRLIELYVKRDEIVQDRIRRIEKTGWGTKTVKPAVKL